ncbi:hypothetical protein FB451DRAFT_1126873 [Mycena latifolia]|nr:hypothetical protein FB451DRAFT_1126873 [Mycena latifolia]
MLLQDSPFQSILHTNTVPSDADCQTIRDFLTEPRKELADLSAEISRMQKLIEELTQKQSALDDFINAHLAMVSPARRLPGDIVRAIFVACLPSHRNPVITSDESPLLLCQICSTWRCLALSTPRLWAAVHVVLPQQPKLQVLADILASWLERSGGLPLSISVVLSQTWKFEDDALPLLTRLVPFCRRWQHIQFALSHHNSFAAFKDLCPDDVPMLESMSIRGIEQRFYWEGPTSDTPVESYKRLSFLNSPSLWSVSIPSGRDSHKLPLPWTHLRSLTIDGPISCDNAITFLRQCWALENCVFSLNTGNHTNDDEKPISLPHLRHLSLSTSLRVRRPPAAFFRLLILPSLRSLECSQLSLVGDSCPFLPLLEGTSSLERLTLNLTGISDDPRLADCLFAMPLLQHFRLAIYPQPRPRPRLSTGSPLEFIAKLTPSADGLEPVVCPLLTSLEVLSFHPSPRVSDEALLRLVRARAEAGPHGVVPLSQFSCVLARDMQVDILPLLEKEISMGLVVSLEYKPPFKYSYSPSEGTERWNQAPPQ